MKVNILINSRDGSHYADSLVNYSSIMGEEITGPDAPEDKIINEIDESRMTDEKVIASRFLAFLSTRRMTVGSLHDLFVDEQTRLKKEFLEG
jgi:hypothetical protein